MIFHCRSIFVECKWIRQCVAKVVILLQLLTYCDPFAKFSKKLQEYIIEGHVFR